MSNLSNGRHVSGPLSLNNSFPHKTPNFSWNGERWNFYRGMCWHVWPWLIRSRFEIPVWFYPKLWENLKGTLFCCLGHNKGQRWCIYPDLPSLLTALATLEGGGRCGKMCDLWKKNMWITVWLCDTHTHSPLPLPCTLGYTHQQEPRIYTHTHINNYAYTVFKPLYGVLGKFLQAEFPEKNVYYNKSPATWDEVSTHHLRSFIPGTLHNPAVGSARNQPKQPP